MPKQTSSADSPLPLRKVLEEEFNALHGKENLPANFPSLSEQESRPEALWTAVHGLNEKRSALCISGGGIRSATFGLGVLQGLAGCGLLDKFHYLSTVSGGGYIGSWLSAWIYHAKGITGVIEELKELKDPKPIPNSEPQLILNREAQPIRHLREFSNYLTPKTGLMSVDFWTLIATFIRNMFLNWLVLISLLAAAMMIPRFCLVAINLEPDWLGQSTLYFWKLSADKKLQPNWDAFWAIVKQPWETGLITLLGAGFLLIALAMAYAIIDVPSKFTGGERSSQRRFLLLRQLPLFLGSLILAGWWAVSRNVHGGELFQPRRLLPWFVGFTVASYLAGGLIALAIRFLRKHFPRKGGEKTNGEVEKETFSEVEKEKPRESGTKDRRRPVIGSLSRLGAIVVTTALAGFCLWATATRMFLGEPKKIEFTRDCDGIKIPSEQNVIVDAGTTATIEKILDGLYIIPTDKGPARIKGKGLNVERDLATNLAIKFRAKRDRKALLISTGKKAPVPAGSEGPITETIEESGYTVNTSDGLVRIAEKDVDAIKPKDSRFKLARHCKATRILTGEKITLPVGTTGSIKQIEKAGYLVENSQAERFRIARKHISAFDLKAVPAPAQHALSYVCFAPALLLVVLLLVNFLFSGLVSRVTEDEHREWWGRSAAWILITIVGWIVFTATVLWGAQAITATKGNQLGVFLTQPQLNPVAKEILGAFGGVTAIVAGLLALRHKLSNKLGQNRGFHSLLVAVALVFFVLLSIVISWTVVLIRSGPWVQKATSWILHREDLNYSWRGQLFVEFLLTVVLLSFGILMGFFIDANKFSLHATYRNRLIRAYLAASRKTRSPNRFTGFDPDDDFELSKLCSQKLSELCSQKPLHVINAALNLVHGEDLAWQERKAESFTMTGMHCGCLWHGYRPSAEYGKGKRKAITLGTALAISGAAANPDMGYHSSPVVGFLMTLFNVRLGWWLGNPRATKWRRNGPQYSVQALFSEAIGNTTDRYKYVNLSDGGHFENLGLYEMVLRRCHYIVVSDAGEDPECSFADLGEAVRKIRIDFGIPIEFDKMNIYPRSQIAPKKKPGHNCAIGRIRYSAVDGTKAPDGVIVYIKPECYGDEPRDIYEYFKQSETFPHESTANQFFSESQFESYRILGKYTIEKLCRPDKCDGDFRRFIGEILTNHLKPRDWPPDWLDWLKEFLQTAPKAPSATGAAS